VNVTAEAIFAPDDPTVIEIAALCHEGWSDPHSVADMLNAALECGYTVALAPVVLRKMKIEPGETLVFYNADMPRELCLAVQNAIRRAGGPADTIVLALPTGQHVGLLTDEELASAGLRRLSPLIIPR
jgi:hypothetical protein